MKKKSYCILDEINVMFQFWKIIIILFSDFGYIYSQIYGGNDTKCSEFPYVALLVSNSSGTLKLQCGGSLITNNFILTAAHCLNSTELWVYLKIFESNKEFI